MITQDLRTRKKLDMQILELFGRIFLSTIFLLSGISKIFNYEGLVEYMEVFGVSEYFAIPAIILEIIFPLLLIIGYYTKISALVMALFTVAVAVIFHTDFANQIQFISFFKNIAIAGGFLIIFVRGAGKYSIDHKNR